MAQKVAVVGCGAIGITTALEIQKLKDCTHVTIFAKDLTPHTTSNVAAGLWEPYLLELTLEEKITKWASDTYQYLIDNWSQAEALGIALQPVTYATDTDPFKPPGWLKTTLGYSECSRDQIQRLSRLYDQKLTGGFSFVGFTWEATRFIPKFMKQFLDTGGEIVQREIGSLEELCEYDVVINCSGLGSERLVSDSNMKPVRGQVMKVEAPWQCHVYLIDCQQRCSYIIPNIDTTTLGGTKQVDYNTNISEVDRNHILSTCTAIIPSMTTATIVKETVGLRPSRNRVRLEAEVVETNGKKLNVVHNYGHGGAGITLSIGCAREAAELAEIFLKRCKL